MTDDAIKPMLSGRLKAWLLFEESFRAESPERIDVVVGNLRKNILPGLSVAIFNPRADIPPFRGHITGHAGSLRPSMKARRSLKFVLTPTNEGTRLIGTLRTWGKLFFWTIAFPAFMAISILIGLARHQVEEAVVTTAMALIYYGFIRLFANASMWRNRGREADFLDFIRAAMQLPKKTASPFHPKTIQPKSSSPTEVFIRPRGRL